MCVEGPTKICLGPLEIHMVKATDPWQKCLPYQEPPFINLVVDLCLRLKYEKMELLTFPLRYENYFGPNLMKINDFAFFKVFFR